MKKVFTLLFVLFTLKAAFGQGCSDAGFCTMGAMRPDQPYSKRLNFKLRSIEYNFYRGQTLTTAVVYAHTIEFNASLGDRNNIQVKVPYMHINGNLGNNQGVGDISLSFTRALVSNQSYSIAGTIGTKIPTNNSDATFSSANTGNREVDLPMYYQTSLGSFDAIAGISVINRNWLFASGIQAALTNNKNQFVWSDWGAYPDRQYIEKHNVGRNLKRGTDVMFRAERNFRFTNFNFSFGLLSIYRITNDQAQLPNSEEYIKLDKTTGLVLNAIGSVGYQFTVKNGVRLIYGYKITDRKVNPDGLTRHDVLSLSYIYRF